MEAKRYYVYVLTEPDNEPFYVGKGSGYRAWQHATEARSGCDCHKCRVIRKIWTTGADHLRYIVFETDDEMEAYDHERELIAQIGRHNLTNKTDGGDASNLPGERNTQARLREKQVLEIRERFINDRATTVPEMARQYGVGEGTIVNIVRFLSWKHLTDDLTPLRRNEWKKFTWDDVYTIRARYASGGITAEALGREYGTHQTCISKIVRNETWHDNSYTPPEDRKHLNREDMRGELSHTARLTWNDVRTIRVRFDTEPLTLDDLATEYDVFRTVIHKIINNETWIDSDYTVPSKERRNASRRALTDVQVDEVCRMYASGEWSYERIGKHFGYGTMTIYNAIKRRKILA